VQAIPLAVILGGALVWWFQQQPQASNSNSNSTAVSNDILSALDKEAANSTAQYWFGSEDQQQQDRTK
jgi:hypothetical protein